MSSASAIHIVGVVASPSVQSRTAAAVQAVLEGASSLGATAEMIEMPTSTIDDVVHAIDRADAVVFGSPVYRARHTAMLASLLERVERGKYGETRSPLQGTAAAIVMTGASSHHFLATQTLSNTLTTFFSTQVLAPGLYFARDDFDDPGALTEAAANLAHSTGCALVELAEALQSSKFLSMMEPQI